MSTWTKKPLLKANCGVGYQSLNELADSLQALRDFYLSQHCNGEEPAMPPELIPAAARGSLGLPLSDVRILSLGKHATPLIAKGVCTVARDATTGLPVITWASSEIFRSITVLATGVHFVAIRALDTFVARATPLALGGARGATQCEAIIGNAAGTLGTGIKVRVFDSTFTPAEGISYSVFVFQRVAPPYSSTAAY